MRSDFFSKKLIYSLRTLLPILVKSGDLDKLQAQFVQKRAKEQRIDLESGQGLDFIVRLGLHLNNKKGRLDEKKIIQSLASAFGLDYKQVDPLELDLEICTRTISESFARQHILIPLRINDGLLEILIHNPFQPELWEDMDRVSSIPYKLFLGTKAEILKLIDEFFRFRLAIQAAEQELSGNNDLANLEGRINIAEGQDSRANRHIVQAVDYLLRSALRERASDIHIEPKREMGVIRFRIDGVLHTLHRLPLRVQQAMTNRLKGLSRMDIAEKRRPQDGRIQLLLEKTPTDVRVSTVPVAFGEKMVLRLLSGETTLKPLSQLGMDQHQLDLFKTFVQKTHGLILVTGPTGSGKSTTLYSTLKTLAEPGINLLTLEDPIEMVVDDFNQIGIQEKIGVSFGQMLRHILRQDPDIIMIGEMRDLETAEEAVQAALTGHLVFSTLHTNDAPSSLTRLLDLGLNSYLINAAVVGIIAQRLVRIICPHCKTAFKVNQEMIQSWGVKGYIDVGQTLYKGLGCEHCRRTGYLGRCGIFEILAFSAELKEALRQGLELEELRHKVREKKIPSLFEDGIKKVKQGITTVQEVLRVTGGNSD